MGQTMPALCTECGGTYKLEPDNVRNDKMEKPMSEDQAPTPEVPSEHVGAAEELPPEVLDAIAKAQAGKQALSPCMCGAAEPNVVIEIPNGTKIGRATCGECGIWGVDFLAPRSQDQNVIGAAATKAWTEAPRAVG